MSGTEDSRSQEFNEGATDRELIEEKFKENARDIGASTMAPEEGLGEEYRKTLVEQEESVPAYDMTGPYAQAVKQKSFDKRMAEEWMEHKAQQPQASPEKTPQQQFEEAARHSGDKFQENAADMNLAPTLAEWGQQAASESQQRDPPAEREQQPESLEGWLGRQWESAARQEGQDPDRDEPEIER